MSEIKLIAFDLDGTLLTTDKKITERTYKALGEAADKGVYIVPATGRFLRTVPQEIKDMPFINYIISINGSYVVDIRTGKEIYTSEIPLAGALDILSYFDTMPIAYDCYMGNDSFINAEMFNNITDYIEDRFYLDMVWKHRNPVPELKSHLLKENKNVQKIMAYTRDQSLRKYLMDNLGYMFKDIIVTSSIKNNIEINAFGANKGDALRALAEYLGLEDSQTMAFGDSYNDIPMIRAAGTGVCMQNGNDETKAAADLIAPSNDDNGVAEIIEQIILEH